MDWGQIGTWLGISGGTMAVLGPLVKWLLTDWYNKQKELQDIKYKQNKKAIADLKDVVDDMKTTVRVLERELLEYKIKLEKSANDYGNISRKIDEYLDEHRDEIREHRKATEKDISDLRGSIVKLGNELLIIKNSKLKS
jgi:chromosome segregation ATPase